MLGILIKNPNDFLSKIFNKKSLGFYSSFASRRRIWFFLITM